jgi:hypothetical protein
MTPAHLVIAAPLDLGRSRAAGSRRIVGTTAGGGVLTALLAEGWAGIAVAVAVVLVLTVAICWIVADADRPARLALLLTACRGATSSAPGRGRGATRVPGRGAP